MQGGRRETYGALATVALCALLVSCVGEGESPAGDAGEPSRCPCDARAEMEALLGPDFVDCSVLTTGGGVAQCVSDAVAMEAAFLLEDQPLGHDPRFLQYLVGNGQGEVFVGNFNADPTGAGACAVLDVTRCLTFQVHDTAPFPGATHFTCLDSRENVRICGPAIRF